MMRTAARRRRPGFTLLELVATMLVLSIVSVVLAPVITSATDSYATARELRDVSDDAAFALSTIVRVWREAPAGEFEGLAIIAADTQSVEFGDGTGLRLNAGTLERIEAGGAFPVVRRVDDLRFDYIAADGRTAADQPSQAHRIHITLTVRGFTMTAVAFPRVQGMEP